MTGTNDRSNLATPVLTSPVSIQPMARKNPASPAGAHTSWSATMRRNGEWGKRRSSHEYHTCTPGVSAAVHTAMRPVRAQSCSFGGGGRLRVACRHVASVAAPAWARHAPHAPRALHVACVGTPGRPRTRSRQPSQFWSTQGAPPVAGCTNESQLPWRAVTATRIHLWNIGTFRAPRS